MQYECVGRGASVFYICYMTLFANSYTRLELLRDTYIVLDKLFETLLITPYGIKISTYYIDFYTSRLEVYMFFFKMNAILAVAHKS